LWGELDGLEAPVLAVAAELDAKYVGISWRMDASSPKVRAAVIPGAGHSVRAEVPGVYLALLKRFLDDPESGF
jgi:2-succinyl-6-hydroxy-2,4-cyclohexadiene-1-carboxylate synthase